MLQIATGKLFTKSASRENHLRGILYTNAVFDRKETVETVTGRLLSSSSYSIRPNVLVYEFTEFMEIEEQGSFVLASSGAEPYLQDYSIALSFALNCTCSPDIDLARRLTSGQRGLATRKSSQTLVRRFFDEEIFCTPNELTFLEIFIEKLIGLPRRTFLGVMRAIRTYIIGMHRIADDLELAYTLLVASVESLAQDFDGHKGDWASLDEKKRKAVDDALFGADEITAQRVREALLSVEHVALARRFREFAVTHTTSAYFRQILSSDSAQLGKSDLVGALNLAYQSRSKYVHQLRRLPDAVVLEHNYSETALDGRAAHLTLQGLSRLMRSVIIEFVMRQPSVNREPYNYLLERSGVVQVRMAPQHWVGSAEGDITRLGRDKLEGFLQQLASCLLREPNASLTDLRPVLSASTEFPPNIERRLRLPYLALHALFNIHVSEETWATTTPTITTLIEKELSEPSSEALITFALFNQKIDWSIKDHRFTLDSYLRRRAAANGLRLPRLFEAAITLELAERYRSTGDLEHCQEMVGLAVENYPGHERLLGFEKNFQVNTPIDWRKIMLSPSKILEQLDN